MAGFYSDYNKQDLVIGTTYTMFVPFVLIYIPSSVTEFGVTSDLSKVLLQTVVVPGVAATYIIYAYNM